MGELSLAAKLLACRLCHSARPGCANCCEKCTDTCSMAQNCYYDLPEKELTKRALAKLKSDEPGGTEMNEAEKTSRLDMDYLVSNPATDSNFKYVLERTSEETIRGALQEIGDNNRKTAVITALNRQLKKLLEASSEQVTAVAIRQTRAVALDVTTLQADRDQQQAEREDQKGREIRIAQVHEAIGRVQANMLMSKFADVGSLVWLKEIKETKIYRDLPQVGTWDNFCKHIGLSRQKVDEDLQNLATFGEEFLLIGRRFSLGYKDLRQLRQLKYDGESFQMSEDGKTVVIEGETISLGEDAGVEIEAALEKLLINNRTLRERNGKLEKDFKGALKEETLSLNSQLKTQTLRVKELEVYEPSETDREWSVKQMQVIEDAAGALQIAIAKFIIDPRLKEDRHLQANVSAHLQEAELALHDVRTRMDDVIDMFRD